LETFHGGFPGCDIVHILKMLLDDISHIDLRRGACLCGVVFDKLQHFIRHFDRDALVHGRNPYGGAIYTTAPPCSPAAALAAPAVIL
jgi:hypothetical protein